MGIGYCIVLVEDALVFSLLTATSLQTSWQRDGEQLGQTEMRVAVRGDGYGQQSWKYFQGSLFADVQERGLLRGWCSKNLCSHVPVLLDTLRSLCMRLEVEDTTKGMLFCSFANLREWYPKFVRYASFLAVEFISVIPKRQCYAILRS